MEKTPLMLSLRLAKEFCNASTPFRLEVAFSFSGEHRNAVLFGPSGSGKTLTMQGIAGLMRPDAGYVRIQGRTLFDSDARVCLPPQQRHIGYMFQDYALFPHLTVLQNVAFSHRGLSVRLVSRAEKERAMALLERFGIAHLAGHFPAELSGGQKQRAALARSCNAEPSLLLLDEPFSALDPLLRERLRHELLDILREMDIPAVFITHDPEDVDIFAGELVLYKDGRARHIEDYAAVRPDYPTAIACLRALQEETRSDAG
jgi:molybdate transport system ATP-binding protein